jgi:Protein of unknown function (DUF3999)
MRSSRIATALVLISVTGAFVSAQRSNEVTPELQPADFAYGLTLSVPPGAPFVRFDLPADVLTGTAWADLRDLRVFNSDGQTVPFARIQSPSADSTRNRLALQSFRLDSTKPGTVPRIELDAHAQGVELRVASGATPETGTEYLLAVPQSGVRSPIEKLHFDWQQHTTNWQQRVTVSVSSDLDNWRTVAFARPLMDLTTGDGQRLRHADVVVDVSAPELAKYWRVRFGPGFAPTLTGVEAETMASTPSPPAIMLVNSARREGGGAVYELVARQPVARIRITPQDINSVLPILIEGRDADDSQWRPIMRTVAYRLNQDGREELSEPVSLGGQMLKAIRLQPLQSSWGAAMPGVEVERDSVTLILNARGAGPFLLAWGSRAADDSALPIATLVPSLVSNGMPDFPTAQELSRQSLGGPSRLTALARAERTARWKTTLVWVVLIGGAGALALLAFRVYRESAASAQ